MKTAKKINFGMLTAAKNAESTLAKQETKDLEKVFPEGSPLRNEAEKQKSLLGDLNGLPPGHPLLVAMQAAKDRYDQRDKEQNKAIETKKVKQVVDDREKKQARREEDEQTEQRERAAKQ